MLFSEYMVCVVLRLDIIVVLYGITGLSVLLQYHAPSLSGKSISSIPNIHMLTPFEQALLKRRPIIALDGKTLIRIVYTIHYNSFKWCTINIVSLSSRYKGYIPNSVIRKQLGYRPPTPPQIQKRQAVWRPKPVSIWQREREREILQVYLFTCISYLYLQVPKPLPQKEVEEEEVMDLYEVN